MTLLYSIIGPHYELQPGVAGTLDMDLVCSKENISKNTVLDQCHNGSALDERSSSSEARDGHLQVTCHAGPARWLTRVQTLLHSAARLQLSAQRLVSIQFVLVHVKLASRC
jgi:hypothetical protein